MKFDTVAFVFFTVKASTPFVMLPSREETPTNIVSTIPSTQITEVLMYFDNLSICTLSDMFEIMLRELFINSDVPEENKGNASYESIAKAKQEVIDQIRCWLPSKEENED